MNDVLRYAGKRVIVTGAASGTGAVTAELLVELGAEVHVIDSDRPAVTGLASFTAVDLRDPEQLEAAVAKIGTVVNALFLCAGPPASSPPLDVLLVSFCGVRALTEAAVPLMIEGSAIASLSSLAPSARTGAGGLPDAGVVRELTATADFPTARALCEAHPRALQHASALASEAIAAYAAQRSVSLASLGIRINCVHAGASAAPAPLEGAGVGERRGDDAPVPFGRRERAEGEAWPLLFLNSPRASSVTGMQLDADGGGPGSPVAGRIDLAAPSPSRFGDS